LPSIDDRYTDAGVRLRERRGRGIPGALTDATARTRVGGLTYGLSNGIESFRLSTVNRKEIFMADETQFTVNYGTSKFHIKGDAGHIAIERLSQIADSASGAGVLVIEMSGSRHNLFVGAGVPVEVIEFFPSDDLGVY
jgi:hypothetical protein